jgi:hypothetical protein
MVEPVSRSFLIIMFDSSSDRVNRQIFPLYSEVERVPSKNSALARIRQKRAERNERNAAAALHVTD